MTRSLGSLVCFADAFKSNFPCRWLGCNWIVRWCDGQFFNRCDIDEGDVESVVFDGRSNQEFVGCCDIKFAWCEDMVENGFVYVVSDSEAYDVNDGFGC